MGGWRRGSWLLLMLMLMCRGIRFACRGGFIIGSPFIQRDAHLLAQLPLLVEILTKLKQTRTLVILVQGVRCTEQIQSRDYFQSMHLSFAQRFRLSSHRVQGTRMGL